MERHSCPDQDGVVSQEEGLLYRPDDGRTDGRTDGHTSSYLSIRLKLDHKYKSEVINWLKDDVPDYCFYLHKTSGDHFHICVPGPIDNDIKDKWRKRIVRKWGLKGNGGYGISGFQDRLHSFVFYCGHEGTEPFYEDPKWPLIFMELAKEERPVYVKRGKGKFQSTLEEATGTAKDRKAMGDWQLNYANLVNVAVQHRRKNNLETTSLKEVVRHLCRNTKWKPSDFMRHRGVHESYQKDFEFRIGVRQDFDMSWWNERVG